MAFFSHANHLLVVIFLSVVAVSELNNLWHEFCCKFIVSQAGCNFTNSTLKLLSKKNNVVDRIVHLEVLLLPPRLVLILYIFKQSIYLIFIQNLIWEGEKEDININGFAFAHYCWIW